MEASALLLSLVKGIVWATPIADFGAMIISILFLIPVWKTLPHSR